MDVFNIAKSIEKLIFEFLMWLIFYPYTLFRVIFQPGYMIDYAREETAKSEDVSFDSGMKPAIFLFVSIVLAAYIAPVQQAELTPAGEIQTQTGQYIVQSWLNLVMFRMVIYSIFPITFALIYDIITPGPVTRRTLLVPFNQQCYICAPFALVTSLSMIFLGRGENVGFLMALLAAQLWLIGSNYFFFRGQVGKSRLASAGLSVLAFTIAWVVFLTVANLALRYRGMS